MATPQQIAANQANAHKSTGPQTEAGKARSSQNATKHGLRSRDFVVLPQDQPEFEELRDTLFDEIRPQGAVALLHFEHLLEAAWNRRRCRRAEAALAQELAKDPIQDAAAEKRVATLDRYSRRAERAFNKAYKELVRLQTENYNRRLLEQDQDDDVDLAAWGLADMTTCEKARIRQTLLSSQTNPIAKAATTAQHRTATEGSGESLNFAQTNPMKKSAA